MKLTGAERTRILEGSYGPLYRQDRPEIDNGFELVVSWSKPKAWVDPETEHVFKPEPEPAMWLTVTDVVRRTKGGWSIYFRVTDNRQEVWYLGARGYTRSKAQAVDPLETEVDRRTQLRITAEAKQVAAERRELDEHQAERARKKQERAFRDRLRETLQGLSPLAQQILLARLERQMVEAQDIDKAA